MNIYLDGHATTPTAPEAIDAMRPWWDERVGNPGSPHERGMRAAGAIERARSSVAELVGSAPSEIILTSGATEANNLAILGAAASAAARRDHRRKIVVSAIEHKSVLEPAKALAAQGFEIIVVGSDSNGGIDLAEVREAIDDNTLLVSVMAANNEIGVVLPVEEIAEMAHERGALVHSDCAQAIGKIPFDVEALDFASISSHKMYGPPGIGALFLSAGARQFIAPLHFGGGQEQGLRPGTVPTPLAVGFGTAAELAMAGLASDALHAEAARARFIERLDALGVDFQVNVAMADRLPGSLSMRLPGVDAFSLISAVGSDLSISEGSACNSGAISQSHVLAALGMNFEQSKEIVRAFFGRYVGMADAAVAAEIISAAVKRIA